MDVIGAFLGRFHPLLVHLPIGILFLAFLFEVLSASKGYRKLGKAVQPAVLLGTVFAAAAVITGIFLREEGGYDQNLADLHQYFGIATAALCLGVYFVRKRMKFWIDKSRTRKRARILLFVPLIVLLSLTGHWGGSLTHGEDYLSAAFTVSSLEPLDPATRIRAIDNINNASMYHDVIQPILEARCYDCHSSRKQKGDLRLDEAALIRRGGKHGEVVSHGPADSSSLFRRLILPLEDDEHMPPGEKPQLSSSEIALIKYWIEGKAPFDRPISKFADAEKISNIIRSLQETPVESWVPDEEVAHASEKSLKTLSDLGVMPMPISSGNPYLMVNFSGHQDITDKHINALAGIRDQLVWLNFGHTRIRDEQMKDVGKLSNLRVLYLNNTDISDTGVSHLEGLAALRWLSLVDTQVTDACLATVRKLENLTSLFLFGTDLTKEAVQTLSKARPDLHLDTGSYQLKRLPTDTIVFKRVNLNN